MPFLPPQLKLALVFAQVAKNYGPILMHSNNVDLLTKDLGNAMKKQKDILSDPKKGMIMTSYDVLPVIMEVKILSSWVASKLEIDTKGKSAIAVLDEIVQKSEERNSGKYAKDIKDSLEWTRKLFAHPEIQDVLKMEMTEVEKPAGVSIKSLTKFFSQLTSRSQDELTRLNEFLKRAKEVQDKADTPPSAPKAEPQAKDAAPPAAEPPKLQPPKPDAPKP